MADPELSILIAARDEEVLLPGCLASVAGQDLAPGRAEAVVIANGCADRTAEIARAWAVEHPGVPTTVLELPEGNISAALNAGVATARGRYVVIVDADSRMEPHLARRILERAAEGSPAGTIRIRADSADRLDQAYFDLFELGKRRGSLGMMFYAERDALIAAGGFDPALRLGADLVTQKALIARGVTFRHIDDAAILTSTRRIRSLPFRIGMVTMFVRWTLCAMGIGRTRPY
ncbi:MAG: glycosyltransferase [Chloroflexota bacterium]